jgi:hypothetical protein
VRKWDFAGAKTTQVRVIGETGAKILTHHSLMKIIRRIAANELLGAREKPSMETDGNQKTFFHFLSYFD